MTFPGFSGGQDGTYQVGNVALYRDGNLLLMSLSVGCAQGPQSGGCAPSIDLAGIPTVPPQPVLGSGANSIDPGATNTLSGFYLLDPATGAEYIPIRSPDRTPLSSSLNITPIRVGDSYGEWVYFAAPPATTASLTVVSPEGTSTGEFDPNATRLGGVPITNALPSALP
jgi:hypothetical protein